MDQAEKKRQFDAKYGHVQERLRKGSYELCEAQAAAIKRASDEFNLLIDTVTDPDDKMAVHNTAVNMLLASSFKASIDLLDALTVAGFIEKGKTEQIGTTVFQNTLRLNIIASKISQNQSTVTDTDNLVH